MKFKTESGSYYEADQTRKLIRRVKGSGPETRIGSGDWRSFRSITDIQIGFQVLISWGFADDVLQTTWTSPVIAIDPLD